MPALSSLIRSRRLSCVAHAQIDAERRTGAARGVAEEVEREVSEGKAKHECGQGWDSWTKLHAHACPRGGLTRACALLVLVCTHVIFLVQAGLVVLQ